MTTTCDDRPSNGDDARNGFRSIWRWPKCQNVSNAGWFCFTAAPNDWTHCSTSGGGSNNTKSTVVKVFSEDGSESLGT